MASDEKTSFVTTGSTSTTSKKDTADEKPIATGANKKEARDEKSPGELLTLMNEFITAIQEQDMSIPGSPNVEQSLILFRQLVQGVTS